MYRIRLVEEEKLLTSEEELSVEVVESVTEPEAEPEIELSLEELQEQLKETESRIAVFDTKQELEAAKKKLQKLESKKK